MTPTRSSTFNSSVSRLGLPAAGVLNAAVLVVCILGVGLCNYIVDPYNLRGTEGSHTEKKEISYSRSYHHWKLAEFRNRPASVVFLGDSRMGNFYADNVDRMQEVFGNDSYDFSFGGATLYDCIRAFWYANDKIGLRRVYLGLNFNLVNDRWPANRSGPAISLIESPLKYYLNPFISMVTFELLIQPLFPESSDIGDVSNFADPSYIRFSSSIPSFPLAPFALAVPMRISSVRLD